MEALCLVDIPMVLLESGALDVISTVFLFMRFYPSCFIFETNLVTVFTLEFNFDDNGFVALPTYSEMLAFVSSSKQVKYLF